LEGRFDQFNILKIYKEKEMADFRKWILALSVLALVFTGVASAQLTGQVNTNMTCVAGASVPPQIRSEGYTELIGDITLACSGGTAPALGALIPQANIVVQTQPVITSRLIGTGLQAGSEALLMIDEPGSGLAGPGPTLPQVLCTTPFSGCQAIVGEFGAGAFAGSATPVPVGGSTTMVPGTNQAPNVFYGETLGNQLTFYGVPILAPVTSTDTRYYRITNVRINANSYQGSSNFQPVLAQISFNNLQVAVNNPNPTVGYVQNSLTGSFRDGNNKTITSAATGLLQCVSETLDPVAYLRFSELFGTAFKTRVNGNTGGSGIGSYTNTVTPSAIPLQNVPGAVYNAESDFYSTFNATTDTAVEFTGNAGAGVADYGTRLKAVFNNLPGAVSVYISTVNVNDGASATTGSAEPWGNLPAIATSQELAYLVAAGVESSAGFEVPVDPFTGIAATTHAGTVPVYLLPATTSPVTAIWEVVQSLPNEEENYDFGVYVTYSAGIQPTTGVTATLSYAPTPNPSGSEPFTATAGGQASSTLTIPRFALTPTSSPTAFLNVTACNTVLLFPYITTAGNVQGSGFDTGVSIANTSEDPFSTAQSWGTCSLNWYGGTPNAGATVPSTVITTTLGAGGVGSGLAIQPGTVAVTTAAGDFNVPANWSGYMIASCNFQYAHGYAVVTDIGVRNIMSSYLALIVNNPQSLSGLRNPGGFQQSDALNN